MRIFDIFVKKDNKFLRMLNEQVSKTTEAAEQLIIFMNTPVEETLKREEINRKIKEIEREGDDIYDTIFTELSTTFITPFDREDIQALAAKLDDVLDFIHGVAKRAIIYNIEEIPRTFLELAEIVLEQCRSLELSMSKLGRVAKNPEAVIKECQKVYDLETKADEIYADYITTIFTECKDPIMLIKLSKVAQYLEDATDVTEDVADLIKTMIVKYN